MAFEWDPAKNAANLAKHRVGFDDAVRIFSGPMLEKVDMRRDYGEQRRAVVGVARGLELFVVYTWREVQAPYYLGAEGEQR